MGLGRSRATTPTITLPRKTVTAALFSLMMQRDPGSLAFGVLLEVTAGLEDLIKELEAALGSDQPRGN